jgi:hypothetical protein
MDTLNLFFIAKRSAFVQLAKQFNAGLLNKKEALSVFADIVKHNDPSYFLSGIKATGMKTTKKRKVMTPQERRETEILVDRRGHVESEEEEGEDEYYSDEPPELGDWPVAGEFSVKTTEGVTIVLDNVDRLNAIERLIRGYKTVFVEVGGVEHEVGLGQFWKKVENITVLSGWKTDEDRTVWAGVDMADDVFIHMAGWLTKKDIGMTQATDSRFASLLGDDSVWELLVNEDQHKIDHLFRLKMGNASYRTMYEKTNEDIENLIDLIGNRVVRSVNDIKLTYYDVSVLPTDDDEEKQKKTLLLLKVLKKVDLYGRINRRHGPRAFYKLPEVFGDYSFYSIPEVFEEFCGDFFISFDKPLEEKTEVFDVVNYFIFEKNPFYDKLRNEGIVFTKEMLIIAGSFNSKTFVRSILKYGDISQYNIRDFIDILEPGRENLFSEIYEDIPFVVKNDLIFVRFILGKRLGNFRMLPDSTKYREDVLRIAMELDVGNVGVARYLPLPRNTLRNTQAMEFLIRGGNVASFRFGSRYFRDGDEVANIAIKKDNTLFKYVGYDLKRNFDFVKPLLQSNGKLYEHIGYDLSLNPELIHIATKNNPEVFGMIRGEQRNNVHLAKAGIKAEFECFFNVGKNLLNDPRFIRWVIEETIIGNILYKGVMLETDEEGMLLFRFVRYVGDDVKNNKDFIRWFTKTYQNSYTFDQLFGDALKTDKGFIEELGKE